MAYDSKFKRDDIDELFRAVLLLEDEEDCYRFFEDICTINEIHAIAQRLQVAKLLSENKTYNEGNNLSDYGCDCGTLCFKAGEGSDAENQQGVKDDVDNCTRKLCEH